MAETAARLGDATDVYVIGQQLAGGADDQADDVFTLTSVYRFVTPEAASTWLRGAQERLASTSTFYLDVRAVDGAPTMGDESAAFAVTIASGESTSQGIVYYVRVGHEVGAIRIEAQPTAPLEAAMELAVAQTWCLRSAAVCTPLPVPTDLVALGDTVTPMAATPVAATPAP
jgi:hypothetical protein